MKTAATALLLLAACSSTQPSEPPDPLQTAITIFRTVGDAVLRVDGAVALKKYAPEAIAIIDTNADQVITLAELEGAAAQIVNSPETAAGLLAAAYFLHRKKN